MKFKDKFIILVKSILKIKKEKEVIAINEVSEELVVNDKKEAAYEKTLNGLVVSRKGFEEVREWYKNGKLHCEDGPAVIIGKRYRELKLDSQLHKVVESTIDDEQLGQWYWYKKEWWYEDHKFSEEDFNSFINSVKYNEILSGTIHESESKKKVKI